MRVREIIIIDGCMMRRIFFFSSRRRHTRLQGDWSSDVCSSDLSSPGECDQPRFTALTRMRSFRSALAVLRVRMFRAPLVIEYGARNGWRSEERRVGKEGRSWGWRGDLNKIKRE